MRQLALIAAILLLGSTAFGQLLPPGIPLPSLEPKAPVTVAAELNTKELQPGQQAVLAVVVDIPKGLHAQSHTPTADTYIKFEVKISPARDVQIFEPLYPPGKDQDYPIIGKLSVYAGRVIVYVPLVVKADAAAGPVSIVGDVRYQICDDAGTCLPPEKKPVAIQTSIVPAGQLVERSRPELFDGFDFGQFAKLATGKVFETTFLGISIRLTGSSYLAGFLVAIAVGIILNVMPCVLPIVPLKAMSFYEAASHNRAHSMMLGALFSAGVVVIFAVLAVVVVVLRLFDWGQQFSNPWFAAGISLILLIFSLQMFGAFDVLLPSGVYNWVPSQQTLGGNFAMGMFTAIISTPCTFAMFVTLLAWAVSQPAWIGVLLVMCVGVGMALPYFLLSAFPEAARRVPRSGAWAETVKQMLGFLVLASAVFFASPFIVRLIGDRGFWWLLFAVVAAAALFLVIRTMMVAKTARAVVIAIVIALAMLVPASWGAIRLTRHLVDWQPFSQQALDKARSDGKPVVVKFTAAWCANCKVVEATVFGDEAVAQAVRERGAVMLKADLTDESASGRGLLRTFDPLGAIPLTAVYLPGTEPTTLPGIYSSEDLLKMLK